MQINEVTNVELTEASLSDMLTAVFTKDPSLQGLSLDQKATAISNSKAVEKIANLTYNQWLQKYVQLVRVNQNQQLNRNNYKTELKAFVEQVLLPRGISYDVLQVKPQLDMAIAQMEANRGDPDQNKLAFEKLVDLATVARADPKTQQRMRQNNTQQQPTAPSPAGGAAQQLRAMQTALTQTISRTQQQTLTQILQSALASPTSPVRSTGIPTVDAFLNALGVKTR
jgi:hypothetical protein